MNGKEAKIRLSELGTEISEYTERIKNVQGTMNRQLEQSVKILQEEFQKKFDKSKAQLIEGMNLQLQREVAAHFAHISGLEIEKERLESGLAIAIAKLEPLENSEDIIEASEIAAE